MFLPSKQQIAFRWSAERLYETTWELYLWTFTFASVINLWECQYHWKGLVTDLEHLATAQGLYGIRVAQLHTDLHRVGGSHGLHYHCLINQRLDARQVWRLCRKHGMGADVQKVKKNNQKDLISYVARYLTRDSEPFSIPVRKVGAMWGFPMETKNSIKMIHPASDAVTYCTRFWPRGTYGREQIVSIYNSENCRYMDYRTLLCAFDYKTNRRMDSFKWRERDCEEVIKYPPFNSWVCRGDTIYSPTWMPDLMGYNQENIVY